MTEVPELVGWLTLADVVERSGLTKQSLNRMIQNGTIKTVRRLGQGRKPIYVIRDWEADQLIAQHQARMERRQELAASRQFVDG